MTHHDVNAYTPITELQRLFEMQRTASRTIPAPSLADRQTDLATLAGVILGNRKAVQEALIDDFGIHHRALTDLSETLAVAGQIQYVLEQLPTWMAADQRAVDPQIYGAATAEIRYVPKGVIGIISPWNLPFLLSLGPLVDALAAGNRVMIKPSELVPASSTLLRDLITNAFPAEKVAVVTGEEDLARAFSQLPWDHLLYTGSTAVGRQVAAAAAQNLVPLTLELGGKNPVVLTSGSVNAETVAQVIGSKLAKSGQVCIAPDYCYVPESEVDRFIALATEYVSSLADSSGAEDWTNLLTQSHADRLRRMVEEATQRGARVEAIDHPDTSGLPRQLSPTLVVDPPSDIELMREEIFGPVLPVVSYAQLDAVIADLNRRDAPLGLYIFGDDQHDIDFVLERTRSGGVCVNTCAIQGVLPSLGFGGVGASGYGRHRGVEGFREFSVARGVVVRGGDGDLINAMFPPYSGMAQSIADAAFGSLEGA